jgi:hypothetical protein
VKRVLLMLGALALLAPPPAAAITRAHRARAVRRHARRAPVVAVRDLPPIEDTTAFPRVEAVIDSTYRGHARVVHVAFVNGFTPGGSRDIPGDQVRAASDALDDVAREHQAVLIGATDPMRFHETRRKLTNMFNYTLGVTRANYLNQVTGNRAVVSTSVILNDRRGVYVVEIEPAEAGVPIAAGGPGAMPGNESSPGAELEREGAEPLTLDAHLAGVYLKAGRMDWGGPQAGLSVRRGRYELFTEYGRTFGEPDDNRMQTAGFRVGAPVGLFWQVEAIDARKLVVYLDQYTSRATGGTLGIGWAWSPHPFYLNLNGGIGPFDVVTPDRLKDHWEFGFDLGATAGFSF